MEPKAQPRGRNNSGRVLFLDGLRGVAVINMVIFHGIYNLVYIFGMQADWYTGIPGRVWQQTVSWIFILVSGASLHFSSRPYRRGLIVLGCGMVVTLVTLVFMPDQLVKFGILHFIGSAMLLTTALSKWLKRIDPAVGAVLSFALFIITKPVPRGMLGIPGFFSLSLPPVLYSTPFLFPLGFPNSTFWSSDYFSVIPWIFLFITGNYLWSLAGKRLVASSRRPNFLEWLGRRSLLVYMLHQPIIYALQLALFKAGLLHF